MKQIDKTHDIAFLHTGKAHIKTFQKLIDELAPNLRVYHQVAEQLLLHAQKYGEDKQLIKQTKSMLLELSEQSTLTVCTCSSIGSIAEHAAEEHQRNIIRIDRAMADKAVESKRIRVLAALESTLKPTRALLETSAQKSNVQPEVSYRIVDNAWPYFISGDMNTYNRLIKNVIESEANNYDVVVLAQASMAGAAALAKTTTPVLSSPRLGVEAAIAGLQPL